MVCTTLDKQFKDFSRTEKQIVFRLLNSYVFHYLLILIVIMMVKIVYFTESAPYGFLSTSRKTLKRMSERSEQVSF